MKAPVFEIKRFAVHDGDGIRTTVFLKGCTLKCIWCHNPEGISFSPQLAYYKEKCLNCGKCTQICPNGAHSMEDNVHVFDRNKCVGCGACTKSCFGRALSLYGRDMTVDELLPILLEDTPFYDNSNGGVTLSGGECLCHADFCCEILKRLKMKNIHTAVDTCGFVSKEAIDKVAEFTDVFLYDVKAFDSLVHKRCTGYGNKRILENIKYIDSLGKNIEVRIPYVPGYNSGEIEKIANMLSELENLVKVRVLPYHNYAASKYEALEMTNTLPEIIPTQIEIDEAVAVMESYGIYVVK